MFSKIKIGCVHGNRNLYGYVTDISSQNTSFMLDGQFVSLGYLKQKNKKKYDAYISNIKKENFVCENFVPILKFDFIIEPCPVDMDNRNNTDEIDRAKSKINYVIDRCLVNSYNMHLTELELASSKTLLLAMVFSYVLEYILQMNQEIDIILSKEITDYLFEQLYDRVMIKHFIEDKYSSKNKKIACVKKMMYKIFSSKEFKFVTIDSWNKVQNINSCFVDGDVLVVIFEMPRTVI